MHGHLELVPLGRLRVDCKSNRGASRRERGKSHMLTCKRLIMCIFFFGPVPKETSRIFWIRASVRSLGTVGKKASGKRFSCENEDKEPILGIFFFAFGCNKSKNLKLSISSYNQIRSVALVTQLSDYGDVIIISPC